MRAALAAVAVTLFAANGAAALGVSQVYHATSSPWDPSTGPAKVHFSLSDRAAVSLSIFDGRHQRVASTASQMFDRGDHVLTWDGNDALGRVVPAEAYVYTIEAKPEFGEAIVWDPTDNVKTRAYEPLSVEWDRSASVVRYVLRDAGRVRIRVGIDHGGPLLGTVVDWVPRAAGPHTEPWDGMDGAGVLSLATHPELALLVQAFDLPRNSILVGTPSHVELIDDLPDPQVWRTVAAPSRPRMFDYANQPIEKRRDYPARLSLPTDLATNAEGLPIVTGPVPIRVSVESSNLQSVMDERCEAVFFVDGRMAFENQVSFLPMTWKWNPGNASGVHYLTANLRGYEGHFGIDTLKVFVEPSGANP